MKKPETDKHDKTQRETRMRDAIKLAAFVLMAEKGLDKVSMREIAEKVHVTKPVLYYYFKNKEDLCSSIIADHEKEFCDKLKQVQNSATEPEAILYEGLKSHLDFFMKNTLDMDPKAVPQKSENRYIHGLLEDVLKQEEKKGKIPAGSISDIVRLVSGLATEIMFCAYLEQHVLPEHMRGRLYNNEAIARLVKIILLGIKEYYKEQK